MVLTNITSPRGTHLAGVTGQLIYYSIRLMSLKKKSRTIPGMSPPVSPYSESTPSIQCLYLHQYVHTSNSQVALRFPTRDPTTLALLSPSSSCPHVLSSLLGLDSLVQHYDCSFAKHFTFCLLCPPASLAGTSPLCNMPGLCLHWDS